MAEYSDMMQNLKKFKYTTVKKPGTRTQYQIETKKICLDAELEEDSKVMRVTMGKKDPLKPNKTILLVGETGTGKTTLIDSMLTHLMGTTYGDNACITITEEKHNPGPQDLQSLLMSQTSAITVYEFFELDNYNFPHSLTIIDTPGYGDTRDINEDKKIATTLRSLFLAKDGVHKLDAVGLVMKEGTNRLSGRQSYIFDQVVSLFGKDLENLVALVTHSSGIDPCNDLKALEVAEIKIAKDENEPIYFLFNSCQTEINNQTTRNLQKKRQERQEKARETAWDTSKSNLEDFFGFLNRVKPQDLIQTAEVLTNRIMIEACCNTLKERIEFIEMNQKAIKQLQTGVKNLQNEADIAKAEITSDEVYRDVEIIGGRWDNKATRCTKCEENCHFPECTIARSPKWCQVMVKEFCTSCAGKCHYKDHVKDKRKYVTKTRSVTKTVEDYKKKYEIEGKKGVKEAFLSAIQKDLYCKAEQKEQKVEELSQLVVKLDEIAMKTDCICTMTHLNFVSDKLTETGSNSAMVNKINELKVRREEKRKKKENLHFPESSDTIKLPANPQSSLPF